SKQPLRATRSRSARFAAVVCSQSAPHAWSRGAAERPTRLAVDNIAGPLMYDTVVRHRMEPTVKAGQVITTRKVEGEYRPRRGDIVVFHLDRGQSGDNT